MKKAVFLRLALLLLLNPFSLFGQKNFQSGYIVNNGNDTIRGLIDNRDWGKSPEFIRFKQVSSDEIKVYRPDQLISFYLDLKDEYYESHVVSMDMSPVKLAMIKEISVQKTIRDTLFLTVFVKGRANLYYYRDKNDKEHFFIQKGGSEVEELILRKYFKDVKGEKKLATEKRYIGLLFNYLSDCPGFREEIKFTDLRKRDLQKLIAKYNLCFHQGESRYVKKIEKFNLEFGLVAGLSRTTLDFSGSETHEQLAEADFKPSSNLALGISLNIVMPRNRGKWSVYNEALWKSYQTKARYEESYSISHVTSDLSFDVSYIKVSNILRYHLPNGKIRPFFNVGLSNSFAIKKDNSKFEKLEYSYGYITESEGKALYDFRGHELGFVAGLGATFKKFSGEIRYEKGNGMSEYVNLTSKTSSLYFLLGYRF